MSTDNKWMKKTSAGNYFGYYRGYYVFVYKRPHGSYCCRIGKDGIWLWSEGYFGTSLPTMKKVLQFIKSKL